MKTVVIVVLVLVLIVAVGYVAYTTGEAAGLTQAQNIRAEFFRDRFAGGNGANDAAQSGQAGQRLGQGARPAATGTVKSVQGNTITVAQRDGTTVTVNVDAATVIQKTSNATIGDIQPGTNITVLSSQSGSTITAQTIQIRPSSQ